MPIATNGLFATVLPPIAGSYPHKRNCGIKCVLPREKMWQLATLSLQQNAFLPHFVFHGNNLLPCLLSQRLATNAMSWQ
jgi:hypothetical protein